MINVTVFLASSIEELADERTLFGDFIRNCGEILFPMGVNIHLKKCEDMCDWESGNKQDEIDSWIRKSDYFIVLF